MKAVSECWTALLLVISGALLATFVGQHHPGVWLGILAATLVLVGGLGLNRSRQPQAVVYQPRGFATRLLKWVSAAQVEAAILLWFGLSFLMQPQQMSAFRLSGIEGISLILGWVFVLLGWTLTAHLPTPRTYSLITGVRLVYTLAVALDVALNGGPLVIVGVYIGSVLHGVVSMLVQWTLREVAAHMLHLEAQLLQMKQKG